MCLVIMLLCSCTNKDINQDPFYKFYEKLDSSNLSTLKVVNENSFYSDKILVTLSANQMSLPVFCRILSDEYNIGISFSEKLSEKVLSLEFKETDLKSVFNVVSRQLNVDIVKVGNTFYIGELRPEDRGLYYNRILGYNSADLKTFLSSMLSSQGKLEVLSNGLIILNDHETVIRRVSESVEYIRNIPINTWIVQLYFVNIRKDLLVKAGLDVTTSGDISYNMQENKVSFENFNINGIFNVQGEGTISDVFSSPMFILRDGDSAKWKKGDRVPIPQYTTSEYGTVSVSGYDYIDTGFIVNSSIMESNKGGVLTLNISLSDISSYVDTLPVVTETSLNTSCDMESNQIYLLGELTEYVKINSVSKILMFGRDTGKVSVQVWGKIYKISGSVKKEVPIIEKESKLNKFLNFKSL